MHGGEATTAPPLATLPPDATEARRAAVDRILGAYHRARRDGVADPPSMWDLLAQRQRAFIAGLERGDPDQVGRLLGSMFQNGLSWGLAGVEGTVWHATARAGRRRLRNVAVTDLLVSFAEAVGLARVSCYQQGPYERRRDLEVDLAPLVVALEERTGLDLAFPAVGGPVISSVAGRPITTDSVRHAYTAHRLRQLGAGPGDVVVEIGGGIGCLAAHCHRLGLRVSIFDLPWVNALQGYFLVMALGPRAVRLYGEEEGTVQVLPHWRFDALADRSVDYVVNTNSLPEVGPTAGRAYVREIARVCRGRFLSINQEGKVPVGDYGAQNSVRELVDEQGGFVAVSRYRDWLWEGYVEEVFEVAGRPVRLTS